VQQAVLLLLLAGGSCYHASSTLGNRPCRQTIRRWWQRLREEFVLHAFTLRQWFPCLGRSVAFVEFWTASLALQPLSVLMALLHQEGAPVP
jgi:hypothetical protein